MMPLSENTFGKRYICPIQKVIPYIGVRNLGGYNLMPRQTILEGEGWGG
jgi:hypothetical protein